MKAASRTMQWTKQEGEVPGRQDSPSLVELHSLQSELVDQHDLTKMQAMLLWRDSRE